MSAEVKLVQVLIPKSIIQRIDEDGGRTGNCRSVLIRLALLAYLEKSEARP